MSRVFKQVNADGNLEKELILFSMFLTENVNSVLEQFFNEISSRTEIFPYSNIYSCAL